MLVVAEDVIGLTFIEQREQAETFDNVTEANRPPAASLYFESCLERGDHCIGDGLPGQRRKVTGQLVRTITLDAQSHRWQGT